MVLRGVRVKWGRILSWFIMYQLVAPLMRYFIGAAVFSTPT